MNGADLVDGSPVRAALDAGLNEISANFDDLSGLEALAGAELDLDLNLNPLGVEFDLSQLIQEPENAENETVETASVSAESKAEVDACLEACAAGGAAEVAAAVGRGEPVPAATGTGLGNAPINTMQVPPGLVAGRGGGAAAAGAGASPVIAGGGQMTRDPSFGITGPAAVGWAGAAPAVSAGEAISRQSSIDINTLMQVRVARIGGLRERCCGVVWCSVVLLRCCGFVVCFWQFGCTLLRYHTYTSLSGRS